MATGFTQVTASHIQDASGELLASGRVTFYPVNSSGAPVSAIPGGTSGGGPILQSGVTFLVVAGAIATDLFGNPARVADTMLTTPLNIAYRVTITDGAGVDVQGPGYGLVQPTGSLFSLDTYVPYQPLSVTLQPPVTLAIGAVAEGNAAAAITGNYPNYILNLTLPANASFIVVPTSMVFADAANGNKYSLAIANGALQEFQVSSGAAVATSPTVLIDSATGLHYQLQFVSGAFQWSAVSSAVAGVARIVLADTVTGIQWALTIVNNAFTYLPFTSAIGSSSTGQVPAGAIDGVNVAYVIANAAVMKWLTRNGLFQVPGVDYVMTSPTTFSYVLPLAPANAETGYAGDTHYFLYTF